MDSQNNLPENQEQGLLNDDGTLKLIVGDKDLKAVRDELADYLKKTHPALPCTGMDVDEPNEILEPGAFKKSIAERQESDIYWNHAGQEQPLISHEAIVKQMEEEKLNVDSLIEKPVFIASKEPTLINKFNDFLRTFASGKDNYKLLIISPEISDKLYESYWFTKLQVNEQKLLTKQRENEEWRAKAFQTALAVKTALETVGSDIVEYEFTTYQLKKALKNGKLVNRQLKEIIDVLLVFGYAIKTNDAILFNKMKFKLLFSVDDNLQYIRQQIITIKNAIELDNLTILELQFRERELMAQQTQTNGTEKTTQSE